MIYLFFALLGFLDPPFWGDGPWFLENLNLPPDQMEQVRDLHLKHREKVIDLKAELEKENLKLRKLLQDENLNERDLLTEIEKISEVRKNLMKERVVFLFNLKKIIPPEEWQKLKDQFIERRNKGRFEGKNRDFDEEKPMRWRQR